MLTRGIRTMCDDESLLKENSTSAWSAFQKTKTDKITSPANAACARALRTVGAFNVSVVTTNASEVYRCETESWYRDCEAFASHRIEIGRVRMNESLRNIVDGVNKAISIQGRIGDSRTITIWSLNLPTIARRD